MFFLLRRKPRPGQPQRAGSDRFQFTIMAVAVVAITGAMAWQTWHQLAGEVIAEREDTVNRIEAALLAMWPDLGEWPEDQQLFLVRLAEACRLHQYAPDGSRHEGADCLREAVPYVYHRQPEQQPAAAARLEQMLALPRRIDDADPALRQDQEVQ